MKFAPSRRVDRGAFWRGSLRSPAPVCPLARRSREVPCNLLRPKEFGETALESRQAPAMKVAPAVFFHSSIGTQRLSRSLKTARQACRQPSGETIGPDPGRPLFRQRLKRDSTCPWRCVPGAPPPGRHRHRGDPWQRRRSTRSPKTLNTCRARGQVLARLRRSMGKFRCHFHAPRCEMQVKITITSR